MRIVFLATLLLWFSSCSDQNMKADTLSSETQIIRVAVAANAYHAVNAIVQQYEKEYPEINIDLVIGSSGKLSTQIIQGAPFDIFLSADQNYAHNLYERGLTKAEPVTYAKGRLILWSFTDDSPEIKSLMRTDSRIAIPQPDHAPYGKAAVECLQHFGIYEKLKDRLVYGENVTQSNVYLTKRSADYSFTALSVLYSPDLQSKGHFFMIAESTYSPILQDMVLLSDNKTALAFFEYLGSNEVGNIWESFGYSLPNS